MTTSTALRLAALSAASAVALTGCGDDDPVVSAPPATATQDTATQDAASSAPVTTPATSGGPMPSSSPRPTLLPAVLDSDPELEVEDQSGDGSSLVVRQVRVDAGAHVGVFAGPTLLGSTDVPAGTTDDVEVPLTPAATTGELQVIVFRDADGRALDTVTDPPIAEDSAADQDEDDRNDQDDDLLEEDVDYRVN